MRFHRSILVGITSAYLLCLVCGFFVARVISERSYARNVTPTYEAMDRLELDEARATLMQGGAHGLGAYLGKLDKAFGGRHYLLSSDGLDLVSGVPRGALLPASPTKSSRGYVGSIFHLTRLSDDGLYWLAVVGTANEQGPATWAYFLVCFLVTTGLLVFSLLYLVFPLRRIGEALTNFGSGSMQQRLLSSREDEVGQLISSFNGMAEQIERSFRSERALLQDVSHELRAPLARLSLAVHLAKHDLEDPLLEQIASNVQRLSSLVGEITTFHQATSGSEADNTLDTIDLGKMISDIIQQNALEAQLHALEVVFAPSQVLVRAARSELLHRALENVLRNAILHSWQGGRVEISLQEADDCAVVTVRDYGQGVPPESLDLIFEPFYRGQTSQSSPSGLGLGLSIARRGVQWHGGTLTAECGNPGLRIIATIPTHTKMLKKT